MPNKIFPVFWFQVLLFMFAATVHADGKFLIKPFLETNMAYETNYFLTKDNERSVTIYHIRPGLEFGFTTVKTNLLLNYTLDGAWYNENGSPPAGELNIDTYDYIGHDLDLSADTQITDRLKIGIKDTYMLTRNPDQLDIYSNEIIKHKYSKNSVTPNLFYQFGDKFGAGAAYSLTSIDYDEKADEDSQENRGLFNLHYNMNALNSLDLRYQYWEKDYDKTTPDYASHQTMLLFNRELKYYKITLGAGYQNRQFDNNLQKDMEGFVWSAAITADRPKILLSISQNYNDTAIDNEYYEATRFTASIGHLFLEKLNVGLRGYYQVSDYQYNPLGRTDDSWSIACRLDYIRNEYLTAKIESGFETRDSSVTGNDYENSYILIGITLNLNLGSK